MIVDDDLWLGAFDPEGAPRWARVQAGADQWFDRGNDVVLDPQGQPLVVGTLYTKPLAATTYFDRDAWLGQYDVDGEPLWTWSHDGPLHTVDEGWGAAFDADGMLVMVGSTAVRRHGNDALVLELLPPSTAGRRGPASPARPLVVREPEPVALDERGTHRATLQIDFDGGTLRPGDRGSLLELSCLQSELPYPGLALDEQSVQAVLDRVAMAMEPYGVAVRTDDEALPPQLPRTTVLVGGLAEQIGLDPAAAGYSCVVDCGDRWSWDLAFAFARDLPTIANTVLHEAAHTWGLDHVVGQDLLMYPLGAAYDAEWGTGCAMVSDATSPPRCLDEHERWCPPGQQDSHAELLAAFGPAVIDVEPPRVEIVAPAPAQQLAEGEPLALALEVEDDDGDPGYRVVVPELEWERVVYAGETALSLALPPGAFTVRVEAIDHAGNESAAEIEVRVGDAAPPRVPTDDGAGEGDDGDVPYAGRLDDGCRIGGREASGWLGVLTSVLAAGGRARRRRRSASEEGKLDEAEAVLRQTLRTLEERLGVDHPDVAIPMSLLGQVLMERGRAKEALPLLERVRVLWQPGQAPPEDVAAVLFALGSALWESGEDRKRGVELVTRAHGHYRQLGDARADEVEQTAAWLRAHGAKVD